MQLDAGAKCAVLDGRQHRKLLFYHVLQSRAQARVGSSLGHDGCPPDVYKALPFIVVAEVWAYFKERLDNIWSDDPPTWKFIECFGMSKDARSNMLNKFRWIASLDCVQQWYLRSLMKCYMYGAQDSQFATYGFKSGSCR